MDAALGISMEIKQPLLDERDSMLWPAHDSLRLLCFLQGSGVSPLLFACRATRHQYGDLIALQRKANTDPEGFQHVFEAQAAMASLELVLAEAENSLVKPGAGGLMAATSSFEGALAELADLESSLHTEMRYIYGPDWELKPGKLISKKGTWLKSSTHFSWDIPDSEKFYMPHGVVMPTLQIGKVTDPVELRRHEWGSQHHRVWLKPAILDTLQARHLVWFIYLPHWEVVGQAIAAAVDTWLKRSCQMSGELQPFELIYVPKGLSLQLTCEPEAVEEQWEKFRHPHVHQHRKVTLAAAPLTVKQEKYDIFVGQSEQSHRWAPEAVHAE